MEEWPKYYPNQLIVNQGDGIAIVCGWTKKEYVWSLLSDKSKERVSIVGQLYSKEGINYVIRNIFLNPGIRYIVMTGSDLSRSMEEMGNLFEAGTSKYLHPEIPEEAIRTFCSYFSCHHSSVALEELDGFISSMDIPSNWREQKESFPEHHITMAETFPSEETAFRVEDKKIADNWLKVIDRIIRFGKEKMSSYDEPQRELLNVVSVITDDDPDEPFLPEYMYFDKDDLFRYYPQLMTADVFEGIEYTYGSRLRNNSGKDQIEEMIKELERERFSRRAIAFTWDVEKDCGNPKCPCLDLVQAIVQREKLYLTAYFRSNDMYRAWPQNAYGLLAVQKELVSRLGLKKGKMTIISCSAHIYERDLEEAKNLLKNHKPKTECNIDQRGSFAIGTEREEIVVRHLDGDGLFLQEIRGKDYLGIRDRIAPFISDPAHGIYMGAELMKAERAIREGKEYIQDS